MLPDAGADKEKQDCVGLTPLVERLWTYLAAPTEGYHAPIRRCIKFMVEYRARTPHELIQDFEDHVGQTPQSDTKLLA